MAGPPPASRRLPLLFAVVTVPATLALVWLGWTVVQQDRRTAHDRRAAEREQAADVGVAALARTLAEFERSLSSANGSGSTPPESPFAARTPVLTFDAHGVVSRSGLLLPFAPAVSRPAVVLPEPFALADSLEFATNDAGGVIRVTLPFSRHDDPAIRAEAWLRLARNYGKSGNLNQALDAFRALSQLGDATVQGLPAGLMGRSGRALLFAGAGHARDLRQEALALLDDLATGRWRLTHAQFEHSLHQVSAWLGRDAAELRPRIDAERLALIATADAIWREGVPSGPPNPRRTMRVNDTPMLVLARPAPRGVTVMLVSAPVLRDAWQANLPPAAAAVDLSIADPENRDVIGTAGPSLSGRAVRTMTRSGLPWTLSAADRPAADADRLSSGARLMLAGVALMVVVVVLSGYAIMRAVGREMRVARLQADFVAAVSHEFRTPLTTIRQLSEMLARSRVSSDERRQQFYDALLSESERLQRLVEGLLDFGRMESGRMAFRLEPVDLPAVVQEISAHVGREAPAGYRIEVEPAAGVPPVRVDREAIGHALRNLLDNAIKYSPDHKVVSVKINGHRDHVSIQVRDHGFGIPLTEQRDIFEKFVRGAGSTARNIAGTGVGLAMARQIVEAHRGTITVESTPGEGSTFTIDLPAEPATGL